MARQDDDDDDDDMNKRDFALDNPEGFICYKNITKSNQKFDVFDSTRSKNIFS